MPAPPAFQALFALPRPELEQKVALLYEQGLLDLQERMHPGSVQRPVPEGIHIHGAPSGPLVPGAGESSEELAQHGLRVMRAMMAPVREQICEDLRTQPGRFQDPGEAAGRIIGHLTRVSPPDELFVAAACLLLREGIAAFCSGPEVTP